MQTLNIPNPFDSGDRFFPGNPESRTIDKRNPNYKINYVLNFWMDMCDAPYSLYLRTLYPALMEAVWTYYKPDLVQIFTAYVRPLGMYKTARGGPHGGGNRKRKNTKAWNRYWRKFTNFDPSNKLGRWLPFDPDWRVRSPTRGVITLWNLYDVEQRVAYWIMIYEVVEQFFYNWANGVANSYYCQQQYRPWLFATSADDGNLGVLPETPIVIETVVKARHVGFVGGNAVSVLGRGSSCIFQATMVNDAGAPPDEGPQFIRIKHESGIVVDSDAFTGNGSTVVVSAAAPTFGIWTFWVAGPRNFQIGDLEMTVIGHQNYIEFDGPIDI